MTFCHNCLVVRIILYIFASQFNSNTKNIRMKRFFALMTLMLALSISAFSQTELAFGLGYSYLQGAVNVEAQRGHFGIGAGWFPARMPGDKTLQNSFSAAASYYMRTNDKLNDAVTFWQYLSPYASLGVASAGYRAQYDYGYGWTDDVVELMGIGIIGIKTHFWRVGIKAGIGYGLGKTGRALAWEAGAQFRLFTYTKQ